jgi:hypothetical protein
MALLLARCADAPNPTGEQEQHLAATYCADARTRLAAAWRDLAIDPTPHAELSDWWYDELPPGRGPWD